MKNCNFLCFCQIFMIFLPKCRAFYVVLVKGHGAGEKRAWPSAMLKLARGKNIQEAFFLLSLFLYILTSVEDRAKLQLISF